MKAACIISALLLGLSLALIVFSAFKLAQSALRAFKCVLAGE